MCAYLIIAWPTERLEMSRPTGPQEIGSSTFQFPPKNVAAVDQPKHTRRAAAKNERDDRRSIENSREAEL